MKNKVMYPGTFDPITLGHLDIITRASKIFDNIVIAIAANPSKKPWFNLDERVFLARKVTMHLSNVEVIGFSGLLINFAKLQNITILIHGLRSTSDFEYELQLEKINHHLMPNIENIFFMSSLNFSFISTSLLKEIALHAGNIKSFVPNLVGHAILKKIACFQNKDLSNKLNVDILNTKK